MHSRTAIISFSPKVVSAGLIYEASALHSARTEDAFNRSKRECDFAAMRTVLFDRFAALDENVSTPGPLANEPMLSASLFAKPGPVSKRLLKLAEFLRCGGGFVKR